MKNEPRCDRTMIDSLGRPIRYLRLSVTRTCAMQCSYCRPAALGRDRRPVLTAEEIVALVRHLVVCHGLAKVRLTGGEPMSRPDLPQLVRRLSVVEGLKELAMTTNGLLLAQQAAALADAGLQRVNVSLDSLCPKTFARITGVDGLDQVLRGVDAAVAAGLAPLKLNTVVVRGENDDELPALLEFAARRQLEIRFIELMPMGPLADRWADRFVSEGEMRDRLIGTAVAWQPLPVGPDSARRFRVRLADGRRAAVGFITPVSHPFCDCCDRLRIAADGTLYPCLMGQPAGTLLSAIRPLFDPQAIDRFLCAGMANKAARHPACGAAVMTHIGG